RRRSSSPWRPRASSSSRRSSPQAIPSSTPSSASTTASTRRAGKTRALEGRDAQVTATASAGTMTAWLPRPEIGPPSSMLALLQIFVLMGGLSLDTFSLTVAPVDLSPEWTEVELREPLTARTGNPRLIVYVRDLGQLGIERKR